MLFRPEARAEDYSEERLPQLNLRLQEQEPRYSEAQLLIRPLVVLVEGVYLAAVVLIQQQALQAACLEAVQEQRIQQERERELGEAYLVAVLGHPIQQLLPEVAFLGEELHQQIHQLVLEQGEDYLEVALEQPIHQ